MFTAFTPRRRRRAVLASVLLVLVAVLGRPAWTHARAAALLLRFADASSGGRGLASLGVVPVDEADATFQDGDPGDPWSRSVPVRLYTPHGVRDPPGLVVVHGVHRLGIDEPRLVRFARAIAGAGILVLTPEIREIADYTVDPVSIGTIGASVQELRRRIAPRRTVGLMGMSFAGGLSLLAAADPRFAPDVDFVVSIGGHDDLARVSRFFATDAIARPDGTILTLHAHEYGPLVLVYSHAQDFFPAEDVPVARDALRAWLWEKHDEARAKVALLSPPSRARIELLFDHRIGAIAPELLAAIDRYGPLMAKVSPHDRLATLRAPTYLLHGAGDSVIPPSETLWLEQDLPARVLREGLVTSAINHVELGDSPSVSERWAVVHFLARILGETDAGRSR